MLSRTISLDEIPNSLERKISFRSINIGPVTPSEYLQRLVETGLGKIEDKFYDDVNLIRDDTTDYEKYSVLNSWLVDTINDLTKYNPHEGEPWGYIFMLYTFTIYPGVSHLVLSFFSCHYFPESESLYLRSGMYIRACSPKANNIIDY